MAKWNNISPTADFPEIAGVPFPLLFATIWGEKRSRNPFTVGFFIHLQFSRVHWIICWHFFWATSDGPGPSFADRPLLNGGLFDIGVPMAL